MRSSATGFIAQEKVMTYATPEIELLSHGFDNWPTIAGAAGLTWEPRQERVFDATGNHIPGYRRTVGPHSATLGITTEKWKPILHGKHFRHALETVMETWDAPCDALVVIDGGKRILARVTHGETFIPGDGSPIMKETWLGLAHDATGSLWVQERAQRTWCTNQLGGIGQQVDARVRHTGDVDLKVDDLVEKLKRTEDDWTLWEQEMQVLRETPVNGSQFSDFARIHIPVPIPPVSPTRAEIGQQQLFNVWDRYADELGQNAYAGYQAIVEYEDQLRPSRGHAGRFKRAIGTNPNKDKGLRQLLEVAR
jgi:hypothetical protein